MKQDFMNPKEYNNQVEHQIQLMTTHAYLKLKDIAEIVGASSATTKKVLNQKGIKPCEFGYLASDVFKKLKLDSHLDILIKLRKKSG